MGNYDHKATQRLCKRLGADFTDKGLLDTALTHRSAGASNNERLEFLGDALLNCVIAAELFERRPDLPEGDLSRLRASLVRESTLAEMARSLELGECIRLGPGESGSHRRSSILADTFEALLGAVYLDSGYEKVRQVIEGCFSEHLDALPDPDLLKDPKTRLQEYLQARSLSLPEYRVVDASGPPHKRHFVVECRIPHNTQAASGEGTSRRKAEQAAAHSLLERIANEH